LLCFLFKEKTPFPPMACVGQEPLLPHRQDIIDRLQQQHGLILAHDTGTGKTLTAIAAAERFPDVDVLVITPASLVSNFHKELERYCVARPARYTVMSYHRMLTKPPNCAGRFLICDEAHRLKSNGKITRAVMRCARAALRVLLLTATPIVNDPSDTVNLFAMVMNDKPINPKAFEQLWRSADVKKLRRYVSFLRQNTQDFPNVKEHTVVLKMPQSYYDEYHRVEQQQFKGRPSSDIINSDTDVFAFLSGVRRASNAASLTDNPKMEWVRQKVAQGGKFIIYSEWLKAGAKLLKKAFPRAGVVTGSISARERDETVRAYNRGDLNVLILSAAGGEGLDLKGTTDVILLEVPWNEARERQVIGRAARFRSHEKKQTVNVWKLVLRKPGLGFLSGLTGRAWSDHVPSADDLVTAIKQKKAKLNADFDARLRS
jgi:SNF2 family DNA or RNA helicase